MGHRETVTAAAEALKAHAARKAELLTARNAAIEAASADEVPDLALSRWTGLSPAQVRRITKGAK